jgi:AcrR family transcriptional regulator
MASQDAVSRRRTELLELAYAYAVHRGSVDLSLRPLAAAIGSSPRVLLYLFDSKDGLTRELLGRARADELAMLANLSAGGQAAEQAGLAAVAGQVWAWLAAPEHRQLLTLWVDGYARSLVEPGGPWAGFAEAAVRDWLAVLAAAQPADARDTEAGLAERTAVLAVLRGALLDLLATGDSARTTKAVHSQLAALGGKRKATQARPGRRR